MIQDQIQKKLIEIEQKQQVKILHAVESGSRAWGFASQDSDYDVRFLYIHPKEFYLRLEKTRDVIEWQLDETLDINGWDLQKALRLLYRSNPTVFEWSNSPIVYQTSSFFPLFQEVIEEYFSSKAGLYHYLNTARNNYREYLKGEEVKYKKYFYVIRPILACKWILNRKCPPPMLFSQLVEAEMEEEIRPAIKELLRIKMELPEAGIGKRMNTLNEYIEKNLIELKTEIEYQAAEKNASWNKLNELFLKALEWMEQKEPLL